LPNVGPYIYDVSISGFTRSSIYIYDISSLRVNNTLSYHVRIRIQIGLVVFAFRLNTFKHSTSSHTYYMPCPYHPVRVSDINSYIIPFNCCQLLRSRSLSLTIVGVGEGNVEGISVSTM